MRKTIDLDVYTRPIRFAFLVRPTDSTSLNKIFTINTCLWGGMFNPIIPFFKKIPRWWANDRYYGESCSQIMRGYLDFFEPDFIVESEKGMVNHLGLDGVIVLQIKDLIAPEDKYYRKYGLDVLDIYQKLYKDHFQFELRNKPNLIHVKSQNVSFDNFSACVFGKFPTSKKLRYFYESYIKVFQSEKILLTDKTLNNIYNSRNECPLTLSGYYDLDVKYNYYSNPSLFVLNANKPSDLIDFWNLRAVTRNVVAIPVEWLPELSEFCKKFILDNHRPLPKNRNEVIIQPTAIFSRTISEETASNLFKKYMQVEKEGANTIQPWYPAIWRALPNSSVRNTRPVLKAKNTETTITVMISDDNDEYGTFKPIAPRFVSNSRVKNQWANVVRINDRSENKEVAAVFPTDYLDSSCCPINIDHERIISTKEVLISFSFYQQNTMHWKFLTGTQLFKLWLDNFKIKAEISPSGRITQQIIASLGGMFRLRCIANEDVIKLLDKISRSETKSMNVDEFKNKISKAQKTTSIIPFDKPILDDFLESKAIKLGYSIKCSQCGQTSWYELNELNYSILCKFCRETFRFPIQKPYSSKVAEWEYRVVGPFALQNYASGGYAEVLAIRFFVYTLTLNRSRISWSSGLELQLEERGTKKNLEIDFMIFYQRVNVASIGYPSDLIFGEAKSYGDNSFEAKDICRLKKLANKFPGSILVFATMRQPHQISKGEIDRLKKLALWGRAYNKKSHRSRAPVIILTGLELFSNFIQGTWKAKGGKHASFSSYLDFSNLRLFADATQQLYLNLPPYREWCENKYNKK